MRNVDFFGPPGEVAKLGARLYETRLRHLLEPQHLGKYVVIDVDTGEYEVDEVHMSASDRAAAKRPHARLFGTKVGSTAIGRLGGHGIKRSP